MSGIWNWLFYSLPWWGQITIVAIPVAVGFWFAIQIFGWMRVRAFIAPALAVLAALGLLSRARQQGYGDRQAQEKAAEDKAVKTVEQERADAQAMDDADLNKEIDKWSRP